MNDSDDDWEKNVDEVVEGTGKDDGKKVLFNDEDAVDSDEERQKQEELKKLAASSKTEATRTKA
jgi:hypothetical protein